MRAQQVPSSAGWRWLLGGFALYRRAPLTYSMLVMTYWFVVVFLNIVPVLGALLAAMVVPGLSVGLMQGARHLERGLPIGLQTLFGGLKENARTLCLLGALYLLVTLGILGVSSLFDGGDMLRYMLANSRAERAAVEDADFLLPSLVVMTLLVPVMMAWWFAPVLAGWHRQSAAKALFFSFIACWMNWRAFLSYSVALLLFAVLLPGILLALLMIVVPGAQQLATTLILMPMLLIIAPSVFASFYASYRDIFGISEIV
jgi:hypothetical protein